MRKERIKKEFLSIAELAKYSGISERTLRNLLKDPLNPIPNFRIGSAGRIIKIKRADFDLWMESQRTGTGNSIDDVIAEMLR